MPNVCFYCQQNGSLFFHWISWNRSRGFWHETKPNIFWLILGSWYSNLVKRSKITTRLWLFNIHHQALALLTAGALELHSGIWLRISFRNCFSLYMISRSWENLWFRKHSCCIVLWFLLDKYGFILVFSSSWIWNTSLEHF